MNLSKLKNKLWFINAMMAFVLIAFVIGVLFYVFKQGSHEIAVILSMVGVIGTIVSGYFAEIGLFLRHGHKYKEEK